MENKVFDVLKFMNENTIVKMMSNNSMICCSPAKDILSDARYSDYDVIDFQFFNNYVELTVYKIFDENKKYYFRVYQSAEGCSTGYVKLYPRDARAVKYVCNSNNWIKGEFEEWCGDFSIDLDDYFEVEDIEK
jgi:hypothetical protein